MSSQARRSKTMTPDTDKNDMYWEKRKRNNMAAKKSRENKRCFESMIRNKVCSLEMENILLRRELSMIKYRFAKLYNQCILKVEDRESCPRMIKEINDSTWVFSSVVPEHCRQRGVPCVAEVLSETELETRSPNDRSLIYTEQEFDRPSTIQYMTSSAESEADGNAKHITHSMPYSELQTFVDFDMKMYNDKEYRVARKVCLPKEYNARHEVERGSHSEATDLYIKRKRWSLDSADKMDPDTNDDVFSKDLGENGN